MRRIQSIEAMKGFDVPDIQHQENIMDEERWELVREALASLTPKQRKVFQMRELKGLSWIAIGEKMNITRYMVQKHHKAAKLKMKNYLEGKVNV